MLPEPNGLGYTIPLSTGIQLHLVTTGPPSAPPVIFLHGYPAFWWTWRHQMRFLSKHNYRTVAVDLRGFNYSDKPPTGYDPQSLGEDIIALMDHMNQEKATIVGHDYGGIVAFAMGLCFPDRISKLVTINTTPPFRWPRIETTSLLFMQVLVFMAGFVHRLGPRITKIVNKELGVGQIMSWMTHNREAFPPPARSAYRDAYRRSADTATRYIKETTIWLKDQFPPTVEIHQDVLLLWSRRNLLTPIQLAHGVERTIPRAQVVPVPHSGHWPHEEQPDFVNTALLRFLSGKPALPPQDTPH